MDIKPGDWVKVCIQPVGFRIYEVNKVGEHYVDALQGEVYILKKYIMEVRSKNDCKSS